MFINNNISFLRNTAVRFGQTAQSPAANSAENTNNGEYRQKTLYGNDFHGHFKAFRKFKTVSDRFKLQNPNGDVILSGDEWVGANREKNIAIVKMMNMCNLTATAPGNHNMDYKGAFGLSEMLGFDLEDEIMKKVSKNERRVYKEVNGVKVRVSD